MDERENKLFGKDPRERLSGDVPADMGMGVIERYSEHDVTSKLGKRDLLKNNLDLLFFARKTKRDLIAFSKGRSVKFFIGPGLAVAGIVGGVVLYRHLKKNNK